MHARQISPASAFAACALKQQVVNELVILTSNAACSLTYSLTHPLSHSSHSYFTHFISHSRHTVTSHTSHTHCWLVGFPDTENICHHCESRTHGTSTFDIADKITTYTPLWTLFIRLLCSFFLHNSTMSTESLHAFHLLSLSQENLKEKSDKNPID